LIIHGDCLEFLRKTPPGKVKAMFADVPDNIGFDYGEENIYRDRLDPETYYLWLKLLIIEAVSRCEIFWLSYNQIHDLEICSLVLELIKGRKVEGYEGKKYGAIFPTVEVDKFIWNYTFGQYNDSDCTSGYRPILRFRWTGNKPRDGGKRPGTYSDNRLGRLNVDSIREVSGRMLLGDGRAAGPRVPANVWAFPRIVGNSWERVPEIPTQHPIKLMERIILFSTFPGECFVDLFAGSGSSLRANKLGLGPGGEQRYVFGVEISKQYCALMVEKQLGEVIEVGDFDWSRLRGDEWGWL